jgi:hypothetical protein
MKILCSVLLLFLFAVVVSGQDLANLSNSPDLIVIRKEWQEISNLRNPELDEDPFRAVNETNQALRDREETMKQEKLRAKMGLPPEPRVVRVRRPEADAKDSEPSTVYIYKVKVKNTGQKTIQTLTWEYVFFDPGTKQEVGRRQFISKVEIPPGKTENVAMRSASPPTGAVNVKQSGKKLRNQYSEQIVIQSIEFADGSLWQAAKESTK